jgi:hypothetical protein
VRTRTVLSRFRIHALTRTFLQGLRRCAIHAATQPDDRSTPFAPRRFAHAPNTTSPTTTAAADVPRRPRLRPKRGARTIEGHQSDASTTRRSVCHRHFTQSGQQWRAWRTQKSACGQSANTRSVSACAASTLACTSCSMPCVLLCRGDLQRDRAAWGQSRQWWRNPALAASPWVLCCALT